MVTPDRSYSTDSLSRIGHERFAGRLPRLEEALVCRKVQLGNRGTSDPNSAFAEVREAVAQVDGTLGRGRSETVPRAGCP